MTVTVGFTQEENLFNTWTVTIFCYKWFKLDRNLQYLVDKAFSENMLLRSLIQTFHLLHKLSDVFSQELWFLKGRKMPSPGHVGIGDNVLKLLLCPGAWAMKKFIWEGSNASWNRNFNPVVEENISNISSSLITRCYFLLVTLVSV